MFCMDPGSLGKKKKKKETKQITHHQKKLNFSFFSLPQSLFSGEDIHLGHDKVSYKSLLCMVQTNNMSLGSCIFSLGLGSPIQAKIYISCRRTFSSLKDETSMLQSPAFCHIACS